MSWGDSGSPAGSGQGSRAVSRVGVPAKCRHQQLIPTPLHMAANLACFIKGSTMRIVRSHPGCVGNGYEDHSPPPGSFYNLTDSEYGVSLLHGSTDCLPPEWPSGAHNSFHEPLTQGE